MSSVEFVAVGSGANKIMYSEDGKSWTGVVDNTFTDDAYGVAYSPVQNLWVAVGRGDNKIMYSEDGKSWTAVANTFTIAGNGVAYSSVQDLWVAVGGPNPNKIMYSEDGKSWTGVAGAFPGRSGNGNGVASKSPIFVPQLH